MKRFSSQSRIVAAVTLLCVGLALWWSWRSHENAAKAQGHLRTIERSWQVLAASDPAPTAEVAAAWERRVAALESRLQQTRRALGESRADPVRSTAAPAQRAEAFFALAQFVEAQRTQAAQAGVRLADRYEFGFSAYSNSGPVDAELPIVHRQHLVVKAMLESLWGSGARELTRVQREAADTKVRGGETSQRTSRRDGRPEDYFELSPGRELARDGFVDTLAFRVGFTGNTVPVNP